MVMQGGQLRTECIGSDDIQRWHPAANGFILLDGPNRSRVATGAGGDSSFLGMSEGPSARLEETGL
jgi:hypothetical protein